MSIYTQALADQLEQLSTNEDSLALEIRFHLEALLSIVITQDTKLLEVQRTHSQYYTFEKARWELPSGHELTVHMSLKKDRVKP